jgi:hypothetical protein
MYALLPPCQRSEFPRPLNRTFAVRHGARGVVVGPSRATDRVPSPFSSLCRATPRRASAASPLRSVNGVERNSRGWPLATAQLCGSTPVEAISGARSADSSTGSPRGLSRKRAHEGGDRGPFNVGLLWTLRIAPPCLRAVRPFSGIDHVSNGNLVLRRALGSVPSHYPALCRATPRRASAASPARSVNGVEQTPGVRLEQAVTQVPPVAAIPARWS